MRVVDLDRDMSDVIPTGTSLDSEFLFERMTDRTLELAAAAPGRRILDVASGVGQDAVQMARDGAEVVAAEPSERMLGMVGLVPGNQAGPQPHWVRSWGDSLPFDSRSFDAVICKGALDHFDRPDEAIGEMARVTRRDGRVVLAIANFESLACRTGRLVDEVAQDFHRRGPLRARRSYDCPSDHFTRYELELMREQAERHLELEVVDGLSLGWGAPGWARIVSALPKSAARRLLVACNALARRWPTLADVIVLAGRPRIGRAD
jgi:SAM-dependent methyltransferase